MDAQTWLTTLAQKRLILVSGKGGVGKTTFSCSLALYLSDQPVLLLSTDPAHSLADVLQVSVAEAATPLRGAAQVRALDAAALLAAFRDRYGSFLEILVERGSFLEGGDLAPVWELDWPGIDELMGLLEIQRLLREDPQMRVIVDMAPSGHALGLLRLMDFLDTFLAALTQFQMKHRVVSEALARRYTPDEVDRFLAELSRDLEGGRQLLQDAAQTGCVVVAIAEPMSLSESKRFLEQLEQLKIATLGVVVNRIEPQASADRDYEQQHLLRDFQALPLPVWQVPQQPTPPLGLDVLQGLLSQLSPIIDQAEGAAPLIVWPEPIPPHLPDFMAEGKRLLIMGGKGGVGKTTVAASVGWGLAQRYPERAVRVISIDPAHSLGDAFGKTLGSDPVQLTPNLSLHEIDANQVMAQFRVDYLWELADMISGPEELGGVSVAYSPAAWRQLVDQALPGIDEMLSLIAIAKLLEDGQQDLIVLDTAPTGHLLRFLAMPTALSDWLSWIFKLWIKYQNVVGRMDFMQRLRGLRKQVVAVQKYLKDPAFTEFVGVIQAEAAIIAEAQRLSQTLSDSGIYQRYLVQNRYQAPLEASVFPDLSLIALPPLPRSVAPELRIQRAADLLLGTPPVS